MDSDTCSGVLQLLLLYIEPLTKWWIMISHNRWEFQNFTNSLQYRSSSEMYHDVYPRAGGHKGHMTPS